MSTLCTLSDAMVQRHLWAASNSGAPHADYASEVERIAQLPPDRKAAACEVLADRILADAEEPECDPASVPFDFDALIESGWLTPGQKLLLRARFAMSLEQIGRAFGLTRQAIHHRERKALRALGLTAHTVEDWAAPHREEQAERMRQRGRLVTARELRHVEKP